MDRCDFSSIMTILRSYIRENNQLNQSEFLYEVFDDAQVQETIGTIYLMTANLSQAKTHFKKALKIYKKFWADETEMIESKYQEIQELYPQIGIALAKGILSPPVPVLSILQGTSLPEN